MAVEPLGFDPAIADLVLAAGALIFLALLLRLALMLGATPVGSMRQEIVYLRSDAFRPLVRLGILVLALEAGQFLLPALRDVGALQPAWVAAGDLAIDLAQAVLIAIIALGTWRAFLPYSRRSLGELEVVARRSVEAVARRVPRAVARAPPRRGV